MNREEEKRQRRYSSFLHREGKTKKEGRRKPSFSFKKEKRRDEEIEGEGKKEGSIHPILFI